MLRNLVMPHTVIEERVRSLLGRVAKVARDANADADLFRELGVKSGVALELLLSLEDEFSVAIPDEAFGEARSVKKVVALVSSLVGGSP
jgi:acyl carrier protein